MGIVRIIVVVLALTEAGWMTFDGIRAFVVGDYVTPTTGPHAGQLGPWRYAVRAIGIEPRSALMKSIFAIYGITWLAIIAAFARGVTWSSTAMLVAAAGSLWYLPIGTLCSALVIGGLVWLRYVAG